MTYNKRPRNGCRDIWNAFMVEGARMSEHDIPLCPTTADSLPGEVIAYSEAITIYRREIREDRDFRCDAFVCFYEDDCRFDGRNGIWSSPGRAYRVLSHFGGIIAPDFSTYLDFPLPLRMWNYYRMNAFGYWYGEICGKRVIANARWNGPESFDYCFDGIREGESIVAIGTVASGLRSRENWSYFREGLELLIEAKKPKALLIYGSAPEGIFDPVRERGIEVVRYLSRTDRNLRKLSCV